MENLGFSEENPKKVDSRNLGNLRSWKLNKNLGKNVKSWDLGTKKGESRNSIPPLYKYPTKF